METRNFIIPASNQYDVEEQIQKLNKRAIKLSLPEIIVTFGKAFIDYKLINGQNTEILFLPVEIYGPLNVSYDGWQFVATLQHLSTGENIIRHLVEDFDTPVKYHNSGSNCEHCNVKRYRKDTYLLHHTDGRFVQVGSSCIKDFLGGHSPDNILKMAAFAAEIIHFMNGSSHVSNSEFNDDEIFHITKFLANTVAVIRNYGWVSKANARDNDLVPTSSKVIDNILYQETAINLTDFDKNKAALATEWAENISDTECNDSDYLHNIRAIARSGMVGMRTAGFAASIIPAYDRAIAKLQSPKISKHIGEIKSRIDLTLSLKDIFIGESTYGIFYKYTFLDQDNNIFVWISSYDHKLEKGNHYKINGLVKDHSEFRNQKQTILSHCKVLNDSLS